MEIQCSHCYWVWKYKGGSKFWATCPSCMRKTKITKQTKLPTVKK